MTDLELAAVIRAVRSELRLPTSPWLTKVEAADRLKQSQTTIDRMVRDGLPAYKVRGIVLFKSDELDAYVEAGRIGGKDFL
jgi:excisionase family DNA binding protein